MKNRNYKSLFAGAVLIVIGAVTGNVVALSTGIDLTFVDRTEQIDELVK